jgi:hypothetical protein
MVENTKIQNLKNKILSIINKLNCFKIDDTPPKSPTNTCLEKVNTFSNVLCPYCQKCEPPLEIITVVDKNSESSSYMWCHWCRKKSKQDI